MFLWRRCPAGFSSLCSRVLNLHFYLLRTINVRGGLGSRETFTSARPGDAVTIRVHQLRANIKHKLIAEDGRRGRERRREVGKRRDNKVIRDMGAEEQDELLYEMYVHIRLGC